MPLKIEPLRGVAPVIKGAKLPDKKKPVMIRKPQQAKSTRTDVVAPSRMS